MQPGGGPWRAPGADARRTRPALRPLCGLHAGATTLAFRVQRARPPRGPSRPGFERRPTVPRSATRPRGGPWRPPGAGGERPGGRPAHAPGRRPPCGLHAGATTLAFSGAAGARARAPRGRILSGARQCSGAPRGCQWRTVAAARRQWAAPGDARRARPASRRPPCGFTSGDEGRFAGAAGARASRPRGRLPAAPDSASERRAIASVGPWRPPTLRADGT